MAKNKFYSLIKQDTKAELYIFGDITSWEWFESDVSSYTLSKELQALDVDTLDVHLNSYGGEVAEGLAIYNMLKNHTAKVTTYVDGFACSIASVIFMAGDERIMSESSLLMIHNAWTSANGNANDFRKTADDLDTITEASIKAYMSKINIDEDELKELLDGETWLSSETAFDMNFATSVLDVEEDGVLQKVKQSFAGRMLQPTAELETSNITLDVKTIAELVAKEIMPLLKNEDDPEEPEDEEEKDDEEAGDGEDKGKDDKDEEKDDKEDEEVEEKSLTVFERFRANLAGKED